MSGDRILTVRRRNPRFRSPPLFGNEAVVSHVIELSLDSPGDLHFNLIIGDEWKDVETADWLWLREVLN